jgi:D-methionine transport system substrate-binding protein
MSDRIAVRGVARRRTLFAAASVALAATLGLPAMAQDTAKKHLLIGATAGSNYDLLQKGIVPQLQKKGYQIKLIEFNDYVQPNLALSDGSLDANFFQHRAYFDQFTTDRKLALSPIAQGPVAPMGVNPARISELDLAANPHKLKFVALDAAQLPRVLEDADYVVVNGNFAVSSGLKLSEAVVLEKTPDLYLNVVAVKTSNEGTQWAKDLAAAYRSPEFKAVVDNQFPGYAKPAFLK